MKEPSNERSFRKYCEYTWNDRRFDYRNPHCIQTSLYQSMGITHRRYIAYYRIYAFGRFYENQTIIGAGQSKLIIADLDAKNGHEE